MLCPDGLYASTFEPLNLRSVPFCSAVPFGSVDYFLDPGLKQGDYISDDKNTSKPGCSNQVTDMASGDALADERQVPGEQMWFVPPHEGEETVAYTSGRARRDPRMLQQANPGMLPVTQTECYRRFFMEITEFGLNYAYHMQTQPEKDNFNFRYTH